MHPRHTLALALTLACAAALVPPARAASVSIVNPSFEDDVLPEGANANNVVTGWSTDLNDACKPECFGAYNPQVGSAAVPSGTVPDGNNAFYMVSTNAAYPVFQVLTGTVLQANTHYTLTVAVGNPAERADNGSFGFRLGVVGSSLAVGAYNDTLDHVPNGGFIDLSFSVLTGSAPADIGKTLVVALYGPLDAGPGKPYVLFDNAEALFGFRPWRHYDLLIADGKGFGHHFALEHHESSENPYGGDYFDDWATASRGRDDVAHEWVHSWNGKYRRPHGLAQPELNTQTRNELLWVYEGLTQYWGEVLAVRAGLVTPEQMRQQMAYAGARTANLPGRQWRDLQDTTNTPALNSLGGQKWWDWTRSFDYYSDSALLIWLDADTLIRERSGGQRSLDDFARRFITGQSGNKTPSLYGFDDVVAALNAVEPLDWRAFLRARLDHREARTTLEGLARSGWEVGFAEQRTPLQLASLNPKKPIFSMRYSAGMNLDAEGNVVYVLWGTPAFQAGLAPDDKLVAVQGRAFTPERAEAALKANRNGAQPLALLIQRDDEFRTVTLDVRTGPR
ncbi:peptidase, M61 family, partial [Ostertagia ostertagi]